MNKIEKGNAISKDYTSSPDFRYVPHGCCPLKPELIWHLDIIWAPFQWIELLCL